MVNKSGFIFVLIFSAALLLVSCCSSVDTRVASGYPYNGGPHELKYSVYPNSPSDTVLVKLLTDTLRYISDSSQFKRVFGRVPDIDLGVNNLAHVNVQIDKASSAVIQKRVLINHKAKTCTLELRALVTRCGSASGRKTYQPDFKLLELLVIPKIPEGYRFNIERYY